MGCGCVGGGGVGCCGGWDVGCEMVFVGLEELGGILRLREWDRENRG